MKKHNTFKVVLGTLLVFAILSWIIPAAYFQGTLQDQGRVQAGLFDVFNYSLTSLSYFGHYALYVIFVGGLYGVLNKIPAYRNLLDAMVKKVYGKEKVVLSVIMVLFAIIVSVYGIEIEMLLFVPFLVSFILMMGFDKMVAALAVAGSSLVGITGYTYAYGKLSVLLQLLGLDIASDVYVKAMILLVGLVLLIFNTLLYISKNDTTKITEIKADKKKDAKVEEVKVATKVEEKPAAKKTTKKTTTKTTAAKKATSKTATKKTTTKTTTKKASTSKASRKDNKAAAKDDGVIVVKTNLSDDANAFIPAPVELKQKVWPMVVVLVLATVLVLMAFFPWSSSFALDWFEVASQKVAEFELFGFPLFGKLFGTFQAFGGWQCYDLFFPLSFLALILVLIYKVKLSDALEGFGQGAKKALAPAGIIFVIYTILVLVTYHPFQTNLYAAVLGLSKGFNIATTTIVAFFAGLFNGDISYAFQSVVPYYVSVVTNTDYYSTIGVLFQAVYGITMFVAPTSIILMTTLAYLDIPYTKWLASIWKFVVELLVIVLIVVGILVLL